MNQPALRRADSLQTAWQPNEDRIDGMLQTVLANRFLPQPDSNLASDIFKDPHLFELTTSNGTQRP